jgi:hypothetical protein
MFIKHPRGGMVLILVVFLFFLSPSWTKTIADGSKKKHSEKTPNARSPLDKSDFTGKVLVIRLAWSSQVFAIKEVSIRLLEKRSYLVGIAINIGNGDWLKDKSVWYSVDHIVQIAEFSSTDEAKKALPPDYKAPQPLVPVLPPSVIPR